MKKIISTVMVALSLLSAPAFALDCTDENGDTYQIEPSESGDVTINSVTFHELRIEEYKDSVTEIHSTWLQDDTGMIAMISVVSPIDGSTAKVTLHYVRGDQMTISECK